MSGSVLLLSAGNTSPTYISDAVVDVADVVGILIHVEESLDQRVKHQRHLTAASCWLPLLQEVHKPAGTENGKVTNTANNVSLGQQTNILSDFVFIY